MRKNKQHVAKPVKRITKAERMALRRAAKRRGPAYAKRKAKRALLFGGPVEAHPTETPIEQLAQESFASVLREAE